jgi:hypothetical protein
LQNCYPNAAIIAWRDQHRRHKREISLEYLTEEKFYPLGTTDEYFEAPYEEHTITVCGQNFCAKKWRCFHMGNPNLLPYETIVWATSGEPEAVDKVLWHYSKRIRIAVIDIYVVNCYGIMYTGITITESTPLWGIKPQCNTGKTTLKKLSKKVLTIQVYRQRGATSIGKSSRTICCWNR